MTLESLLKDTELTSTIKDLVQSSGRSCPPAEPQTSPVKEASTDTPANLKTSGVDGSYQVIGTSKKPVAVAVM